MFKKYRLKVSTWKNTLKGLHSRNHLDFYLLPSIIVSYDKYRESPFNDKLYCRQLGLGIDIFKWSYRIYITLEHKKDYQVVLD